MVKCARSLLKMVSEYKEVKVYCGVFRQAIDVSHDQITEILSNQPPAMFYHVHDVTDELLIIGYPNTGE